MCMNSLGLGVQAFDSIGRERSISLTILADAEPYHRRTRCLSAFREDRILAFLVLTWMYVVLTDLENSICSI